MRVVVAVCVNASGEVLLAQRAATAHLGGTWEFPGGKADDEETDAQALARELAEELGLNLCAQTLSARVIKLLQRQFDYPDRQVSIGAYVLSLTANEVAAVHGREGQVVRWVHPDAIDALVTPAANAPLIAALRWPAAWHICPDLTDSATDQQALLRWLALRCAGAAEHLADQSMSTSRGVVLRLPRWPVAPYITLARQVLTICQAADVPLLLHGHVEACQAMAAFGFHARQSQAAQWQQQGLRKAEILPTDYRLAVACHSADELGVAEAVAADWAWLSPVLATPSHPEQIGLGWPAWAALVQHVKLPVYALGGLQPDMAAMARAYGGVGVAGISGF